MKRTTRRGSARAVVATLLLSAVGGASCRRTPDATMCSGALASKEPDRAIAACSALIASGTLSGQKLEAAYVNRGIAYFHRKDYGLAIEDYGQAARLNPASAVPLYNRGRAFTERHDYDRAIEDFDRAVALTPRDPDAFYHRAQAYFGAGDFARAIEDYGRALELNPQYASAFYGRGCAHHCKRMYDRAIQDFDEALKRHPEDPNTWAKRGRAYDEKGDHDRALQDYEHALQLDPADATTWSSRGTAYAEKKDYDRALESYDRALALNPKDGDTFGARASIYTHKKDYVRAAADYDRAVALSVYGWSFFRGVLRFARGDFALAERDFLKAQSAPWPPAKMALWLYVSRARAGEEKEARADLVRRAEKLSDGEWPVPAVRFLSGGLSADALVQAAGEGEAENKELRHCDAYFALGEAALLAGRKEDAKSSFRRAVADGADVYSCDAAQGELDRL